jgi:hypothetical protein
MLSKAKHLWLLPWWRRRNDQGFFASLRTTNGNALVVGHGNTIPDIIEALEINNPVNIPDDDYSELLIVTLGDKPQLLRLHYPSLD